VVNRRLNFSAKAPKIVWDVRFIVTEMLTNSTQQIFGVTLIVCKSLILWIHVVHADNNKTISEDIRSTDRFPIWIILFLMRNKIDINFSKCWTKGKHFYIVIWIFSELSAIDLSIVNGSFYLQTRVRVQSITSLRIICISNHFQILWMSLYQIL
jgi:hypothetical protein